MAFRPSVAHLVEFYRNNARISHYIWRASTEPHFSRLTSHSRLSDVGICRRFNRSFNERKLRRRTQRRTNKQLCMLIHVPCLVEFRKSSIVQSNIRVHVMDVRCSSLQLKRARVNKSNLNLRWDSLFESAQKLLYNIQLFLCNAFLCVSVVTATFTLHVYWQYERSKSCYMGMRTKCYNVYWTWVESATQHSHRKYIENHFETRRHLHVYSMFMLT